MARVMDRSPSNAARTRYAQAFTSSIFEQNPSAQQQAFVPAGKRRDQTTGELFGHYDEKDLRPMPKTFVPKDDYLSAKQKKLNFLSSEVLPHTAYPNGMEPERQRHARVDPLEAEDNVDTVQLRHKELSSQLFGRETPNEQARNSRLTPNDISWHAAKEPAHGRPEGMSHADRAYQEKCSMLFDYQSPQMPADQVPGNKLTREEMQTELVKRNNLHYSDLFGHRAGPVDRSPQDSSMIRRPRLQGSQEDRIIIHQDWTDSKTELMNGARGDRNEHPAIRKSDELYQSRVFGDNSLYQPPERLGSVTHDNSDKLRRSLGRTPQQIHQAHLRTSITPDEFYEEADQVKDWEVVELHISRLPSTADDAYVRNLCQGFELQIVKVVTEMDPVRNYCKGRAKIMLRYNPVRDSIKGLVCKLQDARLNVEM